MPDKTWSAIIPAAGLSSRFGTAKHRLTLPTNQTILERLVQQLEQFMPLERVHPVYSPAEAFWPRGCKAAYQRNPIGTADAVHQGLRLVETSHVCIVWGDTVIFDDNLLQEQAALMKEEELRLPLVRKVDPYTAFYFQTTDRARPIHCKINSVLMARECDAMPKIGSSDVGIFFAQTEALRAAMHPAWVRGAVSSEFNFLPVLKEINTCALRFHSSFADVYGINTLEEYSLMAGKLAVREYKKEWV